MRAERPSLSRRRPRRYAVFFAILWLLWLQAGAHGSPADDSYTLGMSRVRSLSRCSSVRLLPFGRSTEERAIPAFVLTRFDEPAESKTRVFICAGQHGDEPSPVAAVLSICGHLASGSEPSVLRECVFIVVPMVNPDGLSRSSRLSSEGLDINRDWLALTTPEARYVDRLIKTWRPHVLIDLHEWTDSPAMPGDAIEVSSSPRKLQAAEMARLAERVSRESRLAVIRCGPKSNPGLFHRRYSLLGFGAFLIETSPRQSHEAKFSYYRESMLAAASYASARADQRIALSPASEGFCLSQVAQYLDPPQAPASGPDVLHSGMLFLPVYGLLLWMAKSSARLTEARWCRLFRRCAVDPAISTDPLLLKRQPRPITSRSWINRRLRSRYAVPSHRISTSV